jgi:hypothetical protein
MSIPNMAGLDYAGLFYIGGTREERIDRRKAVLYYIPHTFAEYEKNDTRFGLCRICKFPKADAACAGVYDN